jgi:hypothetical protein
VTRTGNNASIAGTKLWRWLANRRQRRVLWRDGVSKPLGLRLSGRGLCGCTKRPIRRCRATAIASEFRRARCFQSTGRRFWRPRRRWRCLKRRRIAACGFSSASGRRRRAIGLRDLLLAQFSYSWGLRYRTGDGRAGIGGMPDWYLDHFMVDPVLEADGCIYTDPSSLGRLKIICIGEPDPIDASTIVHRDGRRFPVGLHVWIDKTDGTLMTADREILARPDEKTAKLAIVVQQLVEVVRRREQKTGKPCFLRGGILHAVSDASLASMVALDDHGSGASLLGYELARMIFCDSEPLASGVPSPLSLLGKGLRGPKGLAGEKVRDVIEHEKPVVPTKPSPDAKPAPPPAPSAPAVPNAATKAEAAAKEASDILTEQESETHLRRGGQPVRSAERHGLALRADGDKEKRNLRHRGTRSPPDAHGVYAGNVVIEGVKKKDARRSSPKTGRKEQVESAIEEAYQKRAPEKAGLYRGSTSDGSRSK